MPNTTTVQQSIPRVRIAPSPTGKLHIGTARSALFNYLFAHKLHGTFILRIEDTDRERSTLAYEESIKSGLQWLGLLWDEGPDAGGAYGPYRQSERTALYEKYLQELLDSGKAFICHHSSAEIQQEYEKKKEQKLPLVHRCDQLTGTDEKGVIRFRATEETITFTDLIRGNISVKASTLGDFSIAKSIHEPLYNFTVVVDDHKMRISHVIRGEDHISNTPKQVALYNAFGWTMPAFAHMPLILAPDRSKMSKRYGAVDIQEYRKMGYLPEALINFLALLGWNPGTEQEIFSLDELSEQFSLDHVQKGGAVFNQQKLDWLNGQYIKRLTSEELARRAEPYLRDVLEGKKFDAALFQRVMPLAQQRMKTLRDIVEFAFFFSVAPYDSALLSWKDASLEETRKYLEEVRTCIVGLDEAAWDEQRLEVAIMAHANALDNRGKMLWPLRVALSGLPQSPGPFSIAALLGKEQTLERLRTALQLLQ